jgi:hypothetical protein
LAEHHLGDLADPLDRRELKGLRGGRDAGDQCSVVRDQREQERLL